MAVVGPGRLDPLPVASGDLGGAFRDVGARGCLNFAEGLEAMLVEVSDVDVGPFDGGDYGPARHNAMPFDDGSGAALVDDALYAGGILERDVTDRTVLRDGVTTAPLSRLRGVVRYAYACDRSPDPVYCLSRRAPLTFAYDGQRGYQNRPVFASSSSRSLRSGAGTC